MPEVKIDYEKTRELRELLFKQVYKERKGTHRTDVVHCLLKIFNREMGVRARPTERVAETWIVRGVLHEMLESNFEFAEVEKFMDGMEAHLDTLWDDMASEIKTSSAPIFLPSHTDQYMEDVASGILFSGRNDGRLITLSLLDPTLLVWSVKLTDEELLELRVLLNSRKNLVKLAILRRDFEMLTPIYAECPWCPYNYQGGCPYGTRTI